MKKTIALFLTLMVITLTGCSGNEPTVSAMKAEVAASYEVGGTESVTGSFVINEVSITSKLTSNDWQGREIGIEADDGKYLLVVATTFTNETGKPLSMITESSLDWRNLDDNSWTVFPKLACTYKYGGKMVEVGGLALFNDEYGMHQTGLLEFKPDETKNIYYVVQIPNGATFVLEDYNFSYTAYKLLENNKPKAVNAGNWEFSVTPEMK